MNEMTQPYLWHLLGDDVHLVSWCDVLLALRARVVLPTSAAALLFPLLLLLLLLLRSLFLPTLLFQFHILVRHGHACRRKWHHCIGKSNFGGNESAVECSECSVRRTRDFERYTEVNLDDWDVFHSRSLLVNLPRSSKHDTLIMAYTICAHIFFKSLCKSKVSGVKSSISLPATPTTDILINS